MDVDIKPEEDEVEISPAVIWSDTFDAGYSYAGNWYDTTKQSRICGLLEETNSSDREIKTNSTTVGAQLQTAVNVGDEGVVLVHTEQDNPSTPVGNLIKDESCFYLSPSDIQIGKGCTSSQSSAGKELKDPYSNCKKIGLDFNVGSGSKHKLDLQLLTNGVMVEVSDFAKEVNRAQQHVVCDILEYNFDLGLQKHQRYDFSTRTMHNLRELMRKQKTVLGKPGFVMEVFTLPDPNMIKGSKYARSTAKNYDSVSENPEPADMLLMDKSDLDVVSRPTQHVKTDNLLTETNVTQCAGGTVYSLATDQNWHLMASTTSKTMKDPYPLCKKIGLELDVKSNCGAKEKLDLDLLTKGVVIELGNFAKEVCGTYKQIVIDVLEHNFDLDLPIEKTKLSTYIIAKLRLVVKKMTCMAHKRKPQYLKEAFSLGVGTRKKPAVISSKMQVINSINSIVWKYQGLKEVTERRRLDLRRKRGERATCKAREMKTEKLHRGRQVGLGPQSVKKQTISNETELTLSADKAKVLGSNIKQANVMPFAGKVVKDCYPLCKEVGVELDVKSKPASKTKLDSQLLTNGVMYEVHKFAKNTKRGYMYTVYDILEYNFDLDLKNQKRCQLAIHISSKLKRMAKRKHVTNEEFSKEVFIIPLVTRQYKKKEATPPARLSKRQLYSKRTQEANDTEEKMNYQKMVSKIGLKYVVADAKTVWSLHAEETISIETDETVKLGQDNGPLDFCLKASDVHSGVTEQTPCPENYQVDICRTIINEIVTSDEMQQMRWIFVTFSNCFGVGTGSEKKFEQILAEYRSDILPVIVEKHGGFSSTEKTMMTLVSQLFCGLHLIDGLAHQAKTTLLLWENMILGDKEVGVHNSPNIGTTALESGTVCLVNSVSDAVQELGWAEDGQLVPFETFLTSKREFDEVPLSLSIGHRIDGLFHNSAGVYSIHDDLVEFTSTYGAESSLLAAVVADLEVQQFKAGCRALGLVSKLIIDPLWRALTLKGNLLEMEERYQTLVTKLKEWQEDGRDLVEGNACLFDDIEVPKNLVFDRLTMWTDTDFFELTVQIVELILASFLKVCCMMLPVDLELLSMKNDRFRKDLAILDQLQKAKPNAVSIAIEGMDMCKKNHTWEWLSFLDEPKIVSMMKAFQTV
ncbi:unnamed protein product [Coregonus sp. 'balchen']|nr:unnamed protein product [Coregonus sp. 'balchen']